MIRFFSVIALLLVLFGCRQQQRSSGPAVTLPPITSGHASPAINPYATVDISPMDMSYWPLDYPKRRLTGELTTPPLARIIYSRPHLQGRTLFTDILQYEQLWRLGANEATELQLFNDALIENQPVKAGRYTMYCIPHRDTWTFILNSTTDIWGVQQEHSTDMLRFEVPVINTGMALEYFTMVFKEKEDKAELVVAWENLEARIQLKF